MDTSWLGGSVYFIEGGSAVGFKQQFGGLVFAWLNSGSDFNACVEVDLAICLARHNCSSARTRRPQTVGLHATKVELDGSLNTAECCIDRLAGGHAPGQVWNGSSPIAA